MRERRLLEIAFLLPWVGFVLLTPPFVLIFQTWSRASGFPLFAIYVFVCWLGLIIAGGLLCSRLSRVEEGERGAGREPGG